MILNRRLGVRAPVSFTPNGGAVRREFSNSANSASAFSIKGNAFRMLQNRFLTKVRGHFGAAGQNLNLLVVSLKNDTSAGPVIEVLLDGNSFTTVAGYQEITLSSPVFLNQFTRYGIAFRNPAGSGVSCAYQTGNAAITYDELITSAMLRSNASPVVAGSVVVDTAPSDLWVVDITTEEALAVL